MSASIAVNRLLNNTMDMVERQGHKKGYRVFPPYSLKPLYSSDINPMFI